MANEEKSKEILRVKKTFNYVDGTPCLICFADSVKVEGVDRIGRFYDKVRDRALRYCEQRLVKICAPPNEYSYRLVCKVNQDERGITVTIKVTFTDRTQRRSLFSRTFIHTWDNRGYLRRTVTDKKR